MGLCGQEIRATSCSENHRRRRRRRPGRPASNQTTLYVWSPFLTHALAHTMFKVTKSQIKDWRMQSVIYGSMCQNETKSNYYTDNKIRYAYNERLHCKWCHTEIIECQFSVLEVFQFNNKNTYEYKQRFFFVFWKVTDDFLFWTNTSLIGPPVKMWYTNDLPHHEAIMLCRPFPNTFPGLFTWWMCQINPVPPDSAGSQTWSWGCRNHHKELAQP